MPPAPEPLTDPAAGVGGTAPAADQRSDPLAFAHELRGAGLAVPVTSVLTFIESLGVLGVDAPQNVYWAGRATLLTRPEDVPLYDEVFSRFFLGVERTGAAVRREARPPDSPQDDSARNAEGDGPRSHSHAGETVRWSRLELLRRTDLAQCSPEELEELWGVIARMRLPPDSRTSRRRSPSPRGPLDLRATVRSALRRDGEPVEQYRRHRTTRPRRIVLLVDVSGSMEPYARALLRFAHAAVRSGRPVEVFAFATRLTRLTRELDTPDPDDALRRATRSTEDMSGGTRLGEVLEEFNDRWGLRGVARGAEVVILSDGWDRGDPATVDEQMARLSLVARRTVWVNPLKASPGYAPLAGGMAAALAHVDVFVEGHSVSSLDALASLLSAPTAR